MISILQKVKDYFKVETWQPRSKEMDIPEYVGPFMVQTEKTIMAYTVRKKYRHLNRRNSRAIIREIDWYYAELARIVLLFIDLLFIAQVNYHSAYENLLEWNEELNLMASNKLKHIEHNPTYIHEMFRPYDHQERKIKRIEDKAKKKAEKEAKENES